MSLPKHLRGRVANAAPLFDRNEKATTLHVDADSLIYKVAATTNNLETAKRRYVNEVLTLHFLADAALTRLHLTPKHCTKAGRFKVIAAKPYQGNRLKGKKPELVEPLRYAVGREQLKLPPEIQVVFNDVYEADDSVVTACTEDPEAIYYSEDKDLDCLRSRKLCQHELRVLPVVNGLGWLAMKILSTKKVVGRGPIFFWAQMLMGDGADNIKGITKANGRLCGPAATFALLQEFLIPQQDIEIPHFVIPTTTEADVARFVLGLYKDTGQNPWPEAWLLWLYPHEGYNFHKHVTALGLLDDSELGVWLKQQLKTKWFDNSLEKTDEKHD